MMRGLFAWMVAFCALARTAGAQTGDGTPADSACRRTSSSGVVEGKVFNRKDLTTAPGARVIVQWAGTGAEVSTAETRADARGRFRMCGLPIATALFFRADDGDRESPPTEVSIRGGVASASVDLLLDVIEKETSAAAPAADDAPVVAPLNAAGARTISLGRYNAASGRGTLMGIVVAKETGQALAYADVSIEPYAVMAFASSEGLFRLTDVPAGALRLRARRIGSAPVTLAVTVTPNGSDTVRIALPTLALQLGRVRVTGAVCPNRRARAVDTAIVSILQQVQLNAERSRLLARQYPFEMILQRTLANEAFEPFSTVRRVIVDTLQVDTVTATALHEWHYQPGALIRSALATEKQKGENKRLGASERMLVPQLVDFAEPAFAAAHCFRYAGVATMDGRVMMRVDFEPTKEVREPDVKGALFFDTLSYQILRSTLYFERPSPMKAGDIWMTRVDTWFKEIVPSLPVIDRIAHRTTVGTTQRVVGANGLAATEYQRLLGVRFLTQQPSSP